MSERTTNSKNIIYSANKEMIDYFNKIFLEDLEASQDIKTQIFELDVRIEEMQKTKNLYAFKSSSRRNVFAPVNNETTDDDEGAFIQTQIDKLEKQKKELASELSSLEYSLNVTKRRLAVLTDARNAICDAGLADEADLHSSITNADADGLQFVSKTNETSNLSHNYNILMQEAFSNSFLSSMLTKSVIDNLSNINHKLDMIPGLINTDSNRAKLTVEDVIRNNNEISASVKELMRRIDFPVDSSKPIWLILDEYIMQKRDFHPECVIEASVECTDYELKLHPVFTINLLKLLNIFFDNIFKHANANKIDFKLSLTPNIIEVLITDNGVGIPDDYKEHSPWYSGLHKAEEIIYLLDGHLDIKGDVITGTSIKFGFSVRN